MPESKKKAFPRQKQTKQPGEETQMTPRPRAENPEYRGSGKLTGRVAIITGGDSGIGRAVAIAFAKEGAKVALVYLDEHKDAKNTLRMVEEHGGEGLLLSGDIGEEEFCRKAVQKVVRKFGGLNVLVNNAAVQFPKEELEAITEQQIEKTFRTNIFSMFFMTKAALKHLKAGDTIVNTTSVTAYRGSPHLMDYASTKGAIVSFTRSLAQNLAEKNIRVNAVAPGPIWTPLIPSTFDEEKVEQFGTKVPLGRAGQPEEVAPAFVYLASSDSSYMTGQVLHPNGGEIIGS